jgi:hypothetical protein
MVLLIVTSGILAQETAEGMAIYSLRGGAARCKLRLVELEEEGIMRLEKQEFANYCAAVPRSVKSK